MTEAECVHYYLFPALSDNPCNDGLLTGTCKKCGATEIHKTFFEGGRGFNNKKERRLAKQIEG